MKYKLIRLGGSENNPCECACNVQYRLVEVNEGYDLIQFKRGNQVNFGGLVLEEGEPAFILDTGKFYIGGPNGIPILINGGSNGASSPLAVLDNDFNPGTLIEVPYSSMITANGTTPLPSDVGMYLTILVLDSNKMPIGQGFLTNWNYSDTSAQFSYVKFHDGTVGQLIYKQEEPNLIWTIHSELWNTAEIVNMEAWDNNRNPLGVQYEIIDEHTVTVTFMEPTAGEAVFYYTVE